MRATNTYLPHRCVNVLLRVIVRCSLIVLQRVETRASPTSEEGPFDELFVCVPQLFLVLIGKHLLQTQAGHGTNVGDGLHRDLRNRREVVINAFSSN